MRALGMRRVFSFYLLVVAVAVAGLFAGHQPAPFPTDASLHQWLAHGLLGLGVGLAIVLVSRLLCTTFAWAAKLMGEFRLIVGDLGAREVLAMAVLSGAGEEALFRGLLQPTLGLWITSAMFAVLHVGPNRRFIPWTVMALLAGLTFGVMFQTTGNLLAPIIAHVVVNYLNLRFLALARQRGEIYWGSVGG